MNYDQAERIALALQSIATSLQAMVHPLQVVRSIPELSTPEYEQARDSYIERMQRKRRHGS